MVCSWFSLSLSLFLSLSLSFSLSLCVGSIEIQLSVRRRHRFTSVSTRTNPIYQRTLYKTWPQYNKCILYRSILRYSFSKASDRSREIWAKISALWTKAHNMAVLLTVPLKTIHHFVFFFSSLYLIFWENIFLLFDVLGTWYVPFSFK